MTVTAAPGSATQAVGAALVVETLSRAGQVRLRATGGSMVPAIAAGDLLTFRQVSAAALQPGCVVLVHHDGRLLIHRLRCCAQGMAITRGDALREDDPPVPLAHVLGVLVGQHRGHRPLPVGGRHWLRRQRLVRGLVQRFDVAHRLFHRFPLLHRLAS